MDDQRLVEEFMEGAEEMRRMRNFALRDHFAGLAMQAIIYNDKEHCLTVEDIARFAYEQADAMLEIRNSNPEK